MRSKLTYSIKVFEIVQKNLSVFFEKLPVATRFHPEPMVFLIEVIFEKESKIGTIVSKITKVRKVKNWMNFVPLFSPIEF